MYKESKKIIEKLQREIQIVELADSIIAARVENGIDRIPTDIHAVISAVKNLQYMDDASIYCTLVSHTDQI